MLFVDKQGLFLITCNHTYYFCNLPINTIFCLILISDTFNFYMLIDDPDP